jgi:hypothetical protein
LTAEETGVLVEEPTPQRLALALLHLSADRGRRERIVEQAASFAQSSGSWEHSVEQFLAAYHTVLQR